MDGRKVQFRRHGTENAMQAKGTGVSVRAGSAKKRLIACPVKARGLSAAERERRTK